VCAERHRAAAQREMAAREEEWLDPITQELMVEPMTTTAGNTYEGAAITAWLREHDTDPLTNTVLRDKRLIPNHLVRGQIAAWKERRASRQA
jgi:hypothetical protein